MGVLSGQVTNAGSAVSGATVAIVDSSNWTVVGTATSASDGTWSVSGVEADYERYHAFVQYDDGSNFYNAESLPFLSVNPRFSAGSLTLGEPSPVISAGLFVPNSAIHHWRFDEGSGTTAADSIGTADGTINGPTWTSGTWVGDYALDGDGSDDYVETTTLGTFGSNMDSDFAILLTAQTVSSSGLSPLGVRESGGPQLRLFSGVRGSNGGFEFEVGDSNGGVMSVETDSGGLVDDGTPHRIVCNKTSNAASGLEIWVDGTQETVSASNDAFDETAVADLSRPVYTHAINDVGSVDRPWPGPLDNVIITDDSLTSTDIQSDYDTQPWS